MGRLLAVAGGVGWLCVMALIATGVRLSDRPRVVPRLSTLPPLIQQLNAPSPAKESESWIATRAISAHHVLVVEVTTIHLGQSRAIATQIVDKVTSRDYDEILVYFWNVTNHRTFANRRVQWTRTGGYAELLIGDQ